MPKRNDKAARERRQAEAAARQEVDTRRAEAFSREYRANVRRVSANDELCIWEECMECTAQKLTRADCQTPHCKALRDEHSVFYDQITADGVYLNGSLLESRVDY